MVGVAVAAADSGFFQLLRSTWGLGFRAGGLATANDAYEAAAADGAEGSCDSVAATPLRTTSAPTTAALLS